MHTNGILIGDQNHSEGESVSIRRTAEKVRREERRGSPTYLPAFFSDSRKDYTPSDSLHRTRRRTLDGNYERICTELETFHRWSTMEGHVSRDDHWEWMTLSLAHLWTRSVLRAWSGRKTRGLLWNLVLVGSNYWRGRFWTRSTSLTQPIRPESDVCANDNRRSDWHWRSLTRPVDNRCQIDRIQFQHFPTCTDHRGPISMSCMMFAACTGTANWANEVYLKTKRDSTINKHWLTRDSLPLSLSP